MNQVQPSPAAHRLERLAAYLKEDPANPALLADACEAAIACGEHERAQAYIDSAERLALDRAEWTFRSARLAIARRELARAGQLLGQLLAQGPHPVLAHDLAYVRLLQGDFEACREALQPWLAPNAVASLPPAQQQSLQVLWLRAAHRLQQLDEAMEWARAQEQAGQLHPAARGVASLIALDAGEFDTAQDWADKALQADAAQVEALVARGSLALGQGDTAGGVRLLERALARNPDDGRTWSALGFANLQAMNLPLAQAQLERAVAEMADHIDSWQALGWARLLQGDRNGALAALRQALELDPLHAETHVALGLVLALGGDRAQAESHLREAERLDPENVTARYARALLSGDVKDPQALEALTRSVLDQGGGFAGRLHAMLQARQSGRK